MKVGLFVLLASACAATPATDNFGEPFAANVPADVRRFVIDLQGCNHFAGEPTGGDPERDRFLAKQVEELCTGIEDRQRQLLDRYKNRPDLRPMILDE